MSPAEPDPVAGKVPWTGKIIALQPRIKLMRSFDQRNHAYQGYALRLRGRVAGEEREFTVGIGKAAQAKHAFHVGDEVAGAAVPVADRQLEPVEFYKVSALKLVYRAVQPPPMPPPWVGVPPALEVYRERGHRRLDAGTYEASCLSCIWGCRMPVEITVDQWNPKEKQYRYETFCYGPKSCPRYHAGATRKVPGRAGTQWEEEDRVDVEATQQRGADD
jgi:hypothetical protein